MTRPPGTAPSRKNARHSSGRAHAMASIHKARGVQWSRAQQVHALRTVLGLHADQRVQTGMPGELRHLKAVHNDPQVVAGTALLLLASDYVAVAPGSPSGTGRYTDAGTFVPGPVMLCFRGLQLLKRAGLKEVPLP